MFYAQLGILIFIVRRLRLFSPTWIRTRLLVLATGSEAALPPIPGLAEADPWTNRMATTAGAVKINGLDRRDHV